MASQHENGSVIDSNSIGVETQSAEAEKFETLDGTVPIEECVEKITLEGLDIDPNSIGVTTHEAEAEKFGTLGSAVPIEECVEKITSVDENGDKVDSENEIESESESESENSESESSSSDSSSESSSSSSSGSDEEEDDDDVEVEEGEISDSDEEKMFSWSMVDDDLDHDDDEDGGVGGGPIKSKNELQNLPPVPPVNATLEPHHQTRPVGIVTSMVGAKVIVEGVEKHDPLNEGSILWLTESRKPLGLIDEIFGPVKNPYYIVRYNSESEVPAGIHEGTLISFVPEFADHVLNNKDLYKKGYDASGANDEELSDELEFSDDDKEAEYRRMQKTSKRGANDQNHGKKKNNRKKFSPQKHAAPTIPDAPAAPSIPDAPAAPFDHGNCPPPFSGIGQGLLGGTTPVPSFPPLNAAPNFGTNGVWPNGTFPQQPQSAMLPNGFPTNGMSWYPQNTQISPQMPMPGIPFQQQLHHNQGSLSTTMLPQMQPNMFAQSMYATGLVGQNQMAFGMGSPFPQSQPPIFAAQQGFPSTEMHSNANSGAPSQFHPRPHASRGRKTFHGAGRKGWRPAK